MTRKEFIKIVDHRLRLIRNEAGYTQDKMAGIIGLSKKTLIQIEKGRSSLGWMGAVAVASLFKDSEILQGVLGGEAQDMILSLAFENYEANYENTMGGRLWWKDIKSGDEFKVQQNIISKHYRILDKNDRRMSSSFDIEYILKRLEELEGE